MRSVKDQMIWKPLQILLWGLLIGGLLMRFYALDFMEFKGDELDAMIRTLHNVFGSKIAQSAALSSVGIPSPPILIYFLSIPILVSISPIVSALWIVMLNVLGVVFLYILMRRAFSSTTALEVSALMSSIPWAIIFSRKIWNVDLIFPSLMGLYLVLFSIIESYQSWKVYLFCILFAVTTQFHMSTWFLPLPLALFLFCLRPRIQWKVMRDFSVGSVFALLVYFPYLLSLMQDGFSTIQKYVGTRSPGIGNFDSILWSFRMSSGQQFEYLLGSPYSDFAKSKGIILSQIIFAAFSTLAVLSILFFLFVMLRKSRFFTNIHRMKPSEKLLVLFLLIFLCIHACYFFLKIPIYPHYIVVFFPIIPLCFVLFVQNIVSFLPKSYGMIAPIVIAIFIGTNLFFYSSFLSFVKSHASSIDGDYGIPYTLTHREMEDRLQVEFDALQSARAP